MKRLLLLLLSTILLSVLLVGCGAGNDSDSEPANDTKKTEAQDTKVDKEVKPNLTLPDGFPKDFPIPDEFTIIEVEDDSEGDKKHYVIDVDFDPEIDLEPVFDLYKEYTEKIGYEILIGGEEFFAEDIFQFGSHDPKSASNMFVITIRTEGGVYGSIDVRFVEE